MQGYFTNILQNDAIVHSEIVWKVQSRRGISKAYELKIQKDC